MTEAFRLLLHLLNTDDGQRGLRVIRGPDWKWGHQDGGPGCVGTVEMVRPNGIVSVIWDNGFRDVYRAGAEDSHDLRVVNSGPAGVEHDTVECDCCREKPLKGIRWKCSKCTDYDLCSACYHGGKHSLSHAFFRIDTPKSESKSKRVLVAAREGQDVMQLKGIFQGAEVQRGQDWKWGDQDGGDGKRGTVLKITDGAAESTSQSWAAVLWHEGGSTLYEYRVGHQGMVDLKAHVDASGGKCYYEHLPVVHVLEEQSTHSKDLDQSRRGLRVVRGRDWRWDDQDDGEGHVGTVEIFRSDQRVQVRWDSGKAYVYCTGKDERFDLRIVDNASIGVKHVGVDCSECGEPSIKGFRWRCRKCADCNLCSACYNSNKHDTAHPFFRHDDTTSAGVTVTPRKGEKASILKGIFPGAIVRRGHDWRWEDQDGGEGKTGVVKNFVSEKDGVPARSWVTVRWERGLLFLGRGENNYRLCHKGYVDLEFVKEAQGGSYYPAHLPLLGDQVEAATGDVGTLTPQQLQKTTEKDQETIAYSPIYVSAFREEERYPDCYYPGLTGRDAEMKLNAAGIQSGTYLLRDSEGVPGYITLSVRRDDHVMHFRIEKRGEEYVIGKISPFASLQQLLNHFSRPGMPMVAQLRHPLNKEVYTSNHATSNMTFDAWHVDKSALKEVKYLGRGSFGVVHKGVWNGSPVAIKSLLNGDMKATSEFLKEAERMKRMDHPNVVQLYGVCASPCLIVMEYLENGSLLDYMNVHRKSLRLPGMRLIAGQVASGMTYLGSKAIVHRDLAARNVLVGGDGVAKVSDFGLSVLLKEPDAVYSVAFKDMFPVRWSSPEVMKEGHYSTKSDVWSFGILLIEIVTLGDLPYKEIRENPMVIHKVCGGYRMKQPKDCPRDLYDIMTKCWAEDPDLRPTFEDLKRALRNQEGMGTAPRRRTPAPKIISLAQLMFGDDAVLYEQEK